MAFKKINSVGIVVKPGDDAARRTAGELSEWLRKRSVALAGEPFISEKGADMWPAASDADLVVVLGGDGTMLATSRLVGDAEALVLGINYGGLGYLTDFRIEEMYTALEAILEGDFEVDRRVQLDAEHFRDGKSLVKGRVLNDIVINKAAIARIIEIEVRLNGLFVNSFRAGRPHRRDTDRLDRIQPFRGWPDRLPIDERGRCLTPICPFTLTNRPIVVPDRAEIELKLIGEHKGVLLTLDGQTGIPLNSGDTVLIRKSETTFNLVQPPNRNYFDVLRNKAEVGKVGVFSPQRDTEAQRNTG
jgi:NAD+ kinase